MTDPGDKQQYCSIETRTSRKAFTIGPAHAATPRELTRATIREVSVRAATNVQ